MAFLFITCSKYQENLGEMCSKSLKVPNLLKTRWLRLQNGAITLLKIWIQFKTCEIIFRRFSGILGSYLNPCLRNIYTCFKLFIEFLICPPLSNVLIMFKTCLSIIEHISNSFPTLHQSSPVKQIHYLLKPCVSDVYHHLHIF